MLIHQNPWIVGIGGGILSGFIVSIISRKIYSSSGLIPRSLLRQAALGSFSYG